MELKSIIPKELAPVDPTNGWSGTIQKLGDEMLEQSGGILDNPPTSVCNEKEHGCRGICSICEQGGNIPQQAHVGESAGIYIEPVYDTEKFSVLIYRNRSVMEACIVDTATGEIVRDRIPVEWRARENKLDYLSVSKISAYEQCPACFYHQYLSEEGAEEDSSNFYTRFGSILHEVVELASGYYRDSGVAVNPMTIYDDVWSRYNLAGFEAYVEGKELIKDYFLRNPVDRRTDDALFIEKEWRGELGGCTFGLVLDYAGIMKSDPTTGILKDYKTNRMPFTPSELEHSFQLRVYEIILRKHLAPEIKNWISGYEMFRYGWQQCPTRSEADLADAEQYIADTWKQISNDNTWEEKLNNYCGYRNCRFKCKAYQDYVTNPQRYVDTFNIEGADYTEINKQREQMATCEKIAKTRKDEASSILSVAIQQAAMRGERFVVGDKELEMYSGATQSYNYFDTRAVLLSNGKLDLLDNCMTIGKTKLDNLVKASPELKLQLAGCLSTNYASAYVVSKKAKKV
jgi:hypothetical protein